MKLPLSKLKQNTGQVEGVPKNPRFIKDEKYELLKQSLADDPEFTNLNPILVLEQDGSYIVMGGNMRTRAAKELGWKEIEASVMPADTPPEVIRARIIKHNADYGQDDWDLLANEWEAGELEAYGMDLPSYVGGIGEVDHFRDVDEAQLSDQDTYNNNTSNTLILLYNDEEYKAVIESLQQLITPENNSPSKVIYELVVNANVQD